MEDIWRKLRDCYDMDALEAIVRGVMRSYPLLAESCQDVEINDNMDNKGSPPMPIPSPSPSDNLAIHPFFRTEFALPTDETYDAIVSRRRMRASASLPSSSPAPSPTHEKSSVPPRKTRKGKSKLHKTAGLVAGDSDSSALTQESGDESVPPTPATGTDNATEYAEDEDHEQSPGSFLTSLDLSTFFKKYQTEPSLASKHARKLTKGRRNSSAGRGKATSTRGTKRKKR